jgi:hypothetical protein
MWERCWARDATATLRTLHRPLLRLGSTATRPRDGVPPESTPFILLRIVVFHLVSDSVVASFQLG